MDTKIYCTSVSDAFHFVELENINFLYFIVVSTGLRRGTVRTTLITCILTAGENVVNTG